MQMRVPCAFAVSVKINDSYRVGSRGGGGDWGDCPPKNYESNFIHHDFVQFRKNYLRYKAILPSIVLSEQCCGVYFISLKAVNPQMRLDYQISLQSPPLNLLAGLAPGFLMGFWTCGASKVILGVFEFQSLCSFYIQLQNLGGMAGMIIIEDDPKTMSPELDAASCPNNCVNDIPMVFQLFQYRNDEDGSFSVAQKDIKDNEAFRWERSHFSCVTLNRPVDKSKDSENFHFVNRNAIVKEGTGANSVIKTHAWSISNIAIEVSACLFKVKFSNIFPLTEIIWTENNQCPPMQLTKRFIDYPCMDHIFTHTYEYH